eukprot:m.941570 g.941570  ORF g.941570 m.941570 type:complete len:165 (-) comp23834_c2_seq9:577-1071(-)
MSDAVAAFALLPTCDEDRIHCCNRLPGVGFAVVSRLVLGGTLCKDITYVQRCWGCIDDASRNLFARRDNSGPITWFCMSTEFVGASPSKPVKPAAPKPAVPKPPAGKDSKQYTCLRDCKGETPQEISLKAGDVVTLIEPDTDGWCFVSCRGKEGWVAADCLKQG